MERFTVQHDHVGLAVSVDGRGPRALFVPGMSITVAGLGDLVAALREVLTLATFDLRGHGDSDTADRYGYADFAADTTAVADAVVAAGPTILLGFSLGGDLALDQAATRPETPALFLLDGGTPLAEPLLRPAELAALGAGIDAEPPAGYALTGDQHVAALEEIDAHRRTAVERFDRVTCPVTMIMSQTMAGTDDDRAHEINAAWRRGVDDLVASRSGIEVIRLPGGHDLPLTHPREVADLVRERVDQSTTGLA